MIQIIIFLLILSIPAIFFQAKTSLALVKKLVGDKEDISEKQLYFGVFAQNGILILISTLFGSYLITDYAKDTGILSVLGNQDSMIPAVIGLGLASLGLIGSYYLIFRGFIGGKNAKLTEDLRIKTGLATRVLSGGVFEEIFIRFGLQSFLFWICFELMNLSFYSSVIIAIAIASIVFGALHIPSIKIAGAEINFRTVTASLALNFIVGVVFGYLFFFHGLLAAMFAHIGLHLIWHPIEMYKQRKSIK